MEFPEREVGAPHWSPFPYKIMQNGLTRTNVWL